MEKIPTEKMDAVDRQQQLEIDRISNVYWGMFWFFTLVVILNAAAFICAMVEMGAALDALKAVLPK